MDFKEFKFLVGETVMYCQIIESNIKIIYVNLLNKDKEMIWELIKKETLGSMVKKLQALDVKNQLLCSDDYYYLHQVAGKRNHWCHQTYINFLYAPDFLKSQEYLNECDKLVQDHQQLEKIYRILEDIRINIVRKNRK